MQPTFNEEKANDLIREFKRLAQQVGQLEKRIDKLGNVLRAVFELVRDELHIEPAALAERLARSGTENVKKSRSPCGWRHAFAENGSETGVAVLKSLFGSNGSVGGGGGGGAAKEI